MLTKAITKSENKDSVIGNEKKTQHTLSLIFDMIILPISSMVFSLVDEKSNFPPIKSAKAASSSGLTSYLLLISNKL